MVFPWGFPQKTTICSSYLVFPYFLQVSSVKHEVKQHSVGFSDFNIEQENVKKINSFLLIFSI